MKRAIASSIVFFVTTAFCFDLKAQAIFLKCKMKDGGDDVQYRITLPYALPSGKPFMNPGWREWDTSTDSWTEQFCIEDGENICEFTEKQFLSNGMNRNMSISRVSGDLKISYNFSGGGGGTYTGKCIKSTEPVERPKAF